MRTLLRDLAAISRAPTLSRTRILAGYLAVRLAARWRWLRRTTGAPHVGLFGTRIFFADYSALLHLYREIFIAQQYAFSTDSPAPVIVDCGGNIGLSALYFKCLYPHARVLVFEADIAAFQLLKKNLAGDVPATVEIHHAALGNSTCERRFFVNRDTPGGLVQSLVADRVAPASRSETRVPGAQLSSFIDVEVDLIKLDLEGAEAEVLDELAASGALQRAQRLIVEYHHNIAGDSARLSAFLATLENANYRFDLTACRPARVGGFQDVLLYAERNYD